MTVLPQVAADGCRHPGGGEQHLGGGGDTPHREYQGGALLDTQRLHEGEEDGEPAVHAWGVRGGHRADADALVELRLEVPREAVQRRREDVRVEGKLDGAFPRVVRGVVPAPALSDGEAQGVVLQLRGV